MLKAQFNTCISLPTKKCLYKVEIRKFYVIGWYAIINSNIYQVKEKKHIITTDLGGKKTNQTEVV